MPPVSNSPEPSFEAPATKTWVAWIRNKFLAGLALAAPLIVTFWILQFVYGLLHGWAEGLLGYIAEMAKEIIGHDVISLDDPLVKRITAFAGFMLPLVVIASLGVLATNVIGARVVHATDKLLLRVPMVAVIYKTLKQVIDAFRGFGAKQNLKRVVYIEQGNGVRMLGFATGQFTDTQTGKAMTCVLVPTSPSPMTAILLIVDTDKITDAPISIEDSMKMILSGGLVGPQTMVTPLNQRPAVAATPELDSKPKEEEKKTQPLLPIGLPRAEDFDSGDNDILAEALRAEPRTRRWLPGLGWKKK
ncbi:MAG: DUF502 domain-containing protein [Verrucomicrobiaceae bacterium]|nr:DUF502 domain-containing protein [Verrucomicrobiaceae bacterium]